MELPGFSVFNPRALHSIKQVNGLIGFSHWMVDFDIPPALEARQGKAFRRSLAKYIGFWIGCWIALLVSTAYLVSHPTFRIPETALLIPLWILLGVNSNSAFRNVKSLKLNQVFGYLLKGQMSEVRNIETKDEQAAKGQSSCAAPRIPVTLSTLWGTKSRYPLSCAA